MRRPCLLTVTPRISGMFLMFTTRFGAKMSSFISASRSVPPASGAASLHEFPRRLMAWFTFAALAYSNARIAASLLFQSRQHPIGCQRQRRHAHADRIGNRVRNRSARRDYRRFTESDRTTLVVTLSGHHVHHQLADIAQSRQFV